MEDCPRCYGSCAVVCCALCGGTGTVTKELGDKHYKLSLRRWPSIEWCLKARGE